MYKPLWCLIHKNTEWTLTHKQEYAFERIKDAVSKVPVLKYFNESDLTGGQRDASKDGFFRMQLGQPMTFASRALALAEQ